MFDAPPTVNLSEPSTFVLMATGLVTLGSYLLFTGRWQEFGLPSIAMPASFQRRATRRVPTYAIVDYELRFAMMLQRTLCRQGVAQL